MEEQNSTMRIKMLPCKVCFLQKKKREEIEDDYDLFSVVSSAKCYQNCYTLFV